MRPRSSQNGSVIVEAILVITTLTLCLMGIVYLRQYHVGKLQAMRFARVTSLAYAMEGCPDTPDQQAATFVSPTELGGVKSPQLTRPSENVIQAMTSMVGANSNATSFSNGPTLAQGGAPNAFSNAQQGKDKNLLGQTIPYADTRVEHTTRVGTRVDGRAQDVLTRGVRMKSTVLCNGPISDKHYEDILPDILSMLK